MAGSESRRDTEESENGDTERDGIRIDDVSTRRREWSSELLERVGATSTRPPHYPDSWYRNRTMQEEAHRTVEGQVDWIREIDQKATKTLRFNTILLGLIVPALSFAVQYELVDEIAEFYTPHIALGIGCLVGSIALAGVTYTSSSIEAGVSSTDIRTAKNQDLTDKAVHDTMIDSYARWIKSNRKTIFRNTVLITFTILLMISAVVFLSLGVASALVGELPKSIRYGSYFGLLAVAVLSQVF
ncbi:hypothetical protein NGM10_09930 [Halorussus salilacus]|uniref:hypothetical protein n=1 Tax=Halorussus salilacus TaxID=2953750 RepID=UPI00209D5254|nr:hypothetical protein [Halorussus salilacus]USZ67048.1 hypothetical protein NGM10_09930 [Halorussus salilacus]